MSQFPVSVGTVGDFKVDATVFQSDVSKILKLFSRCKDPMHYSANHFVLCGMLANLGGL